MATKNWSDWLPATRILVVFLGIFVPLLQISAIVITYQFPADFYRHVQARNIILTICAILSFITSAYLIYIFWLAKSARYRKLDLKLGTVAVVFTAVNIFALCAYLFSLLNADFLEWLVSGVQTSKYKGVAIALKTLSGVGLVLQLVFVSLLVICLFWPTLMFSDCLIMVFSIVQLLITIATLLMNYNKPVSHKRHSQVYVILPLFLACAGFVGAGLVFTVNARTRLQSKKYIYYHISICSISAILCIAWFWVSIADIIQRVDHSSYKSFLIANPILSFCGFAINIACICLSAMLNTTPRTKLTIEEYNLSSLTPQQLGVWASLIDAYNIHTSPDIAKGAEALDLMKAYVESPMPGFDCRVLRVYDSNIADAERRNRSYDDIKAWEHLDDINIFNVNPTDAKSIHTLIDPPPEQTKVSKNAAKKAQRKAARKQKGLPVPDFAEKSPEEIEREQQFRITLMSSEALILLTTIHDYDLTGPIKGRFGKILQWTMGSKSWFKPLCIKFGILGTHWPFRQMIFYTGPTKKPTARNAAVLAAVSQWNDNLPRSQRCSLLYNPCYGSTNNSKALENGGWLTLKGPPSHVIDLRDYKGKTVTDYLKAIKYRNQATAFTKAKGEVIETADFTPENCKIAMDLWQNIADKRTGEGHTAVLKDPDAQFLESLGTHNPHGYRKLLFLKVEGEVIASCVLFFLGNTLTSDMQGLEHEKARQYKAYFVMMQETITIALRENIPFVDFGPTTGKAKLDIGCSEIPLLGGIKVNKLMSMGIGFAAGQLDV